jgi:hypothetical protein
MEIIEVSDDENAPRGKTAPASSLPEKVPEKVPEKGLQQSKQVEEFKRPLAREAHRA